MTGASAKPSYATFEKKAEALGSDEDHTSVVPTIQPASTSHREKIIEKANVSPWLHFVAGGYVSSVLFAHGSPLCASSN